VKVEKRVEIVGIKPTRKSVDGVELFKKRWTRGMAGRQL